MLASTVLLFILCSVLTPALCCDWLRRYSDLSDESRTLIKLMGSPLTQKESPVPFPFGLYNRIQNAKVDSQLLFIRDSLRLISRLYHHGNLSSVAGDTDKTEHFLTTIDRQIVELNSCVATHETDVRLTKYYRRLRRYYRRLGSTLHQIGSTASWELLRKETKLHLDRLELLVASIRAAGRGRAAPLSSTNSCQQGAL